MPRLTSIVLKLIPWLSLTIVFCQPQIPQNGMHSRNQDCRNINPAIREANILKLKYHHEGQVKLVVLKEILDSTLVGHLVPIWYIQANGELSPEHKLCDNPSQKPVFYHGLNSFSAVTYFPSTQTLHGVIDQEFFVEYLPMHIASDPDLVKAFIKPIPDELANSINTRQKRGASEKRKSDTDAIYPPKKKSRKDDRKKKMYPEIFLIVDVPPTRINTMNQNKFQQAVMYIISYWNAVDMLLRTLKRVDVSINIAGVLIGERMNLEASGLVNAEEIHRNNEQIFIRKNHALESLGIYFHYIDIIKRDSYDFLVWMTSTSLIDDDVENEGDENFQNMEKSEYKGAAISARCGGMHYNEQSTSKVANRAIVMYDEEFAQYQLTARELGHLMFVSNDDVKVWNDYHHLNCLPSNRRFESSGIMDPSPNRAEGYLQWSYCSEIHFERYSRSTSSCCLLNYPSRTMGWPDRPHPVTPKTQCECYRMDAIGDMSSRYSFCHVPLICKKKGKNYTVGMPLDGTPCIQLSQNYESFCNYNDCL